MTPDPTEPDDNPAALLTWAEATLLWLLVAVAGWVVSVVVRWTGS